MALNINGTTGISGVDGSASAPAVTGTDSNTGINFGTDTVNINTGGSTRATVDSNGRLGIGITSPITTLHLHEAGASGSPLIQFSNGDTGTTSSDGFVVGVADNESPFIYNRENTDLRFGTNNSERMKILSTGQIHVGPHSSPFTTTTLLNIQRTNGSLFSLYHDGTDDNTCVVIKHQRSNGGTAAKMIQFNNSSGAAVGDIRSTGSATSYITSSDYRLKENVISIADGITRLKTLKPYRFNFKVDKDTTVDGFLAHEVTAVPEAISGTKDEVTTTYYQNEDTIPEGKAVGDVKSTNSPVYQGIDQSKLVPLLTAALQEAIAKIETLETKVAALEAG